MDKRPTTTLGWWGAFLTSLLQRRQRLQPRTMTDGKRYMLAWDGDGLTIDDLLVHVAVIGRTGSGKSSAVILPLLRNCLRGLSVHYTTTKISDTPEALAIAKSMGVKTVVTGPAGDIRMNVMAAITRYAADVPLAVTDFLSGLGKMVSPQSGSGNSESQVWENLARELIYHAAVILYVANGVVTLQALHEFITGAATSEAQIASEAFQNGRHWASLKAADRAKAASKHKVDIDNALDYWAIKIVRLNNRTRSSIEANVGLVLSYLNRGELRRCLAAEEPNFWPEQLEAEPTLIVSNWATSQHGDTGRLAQAAERFCLSVYVMNRKVTPATRVITFISDEYSQHVNENDIRFIGQCRSQRASVIISTQNREQLDVAFGGGPAAVSKTDALLSNCGTTIVFASVGASAEWASRRIGATLQYTMGASSQRDFGQVPDLWCPPASRCHANINQQQLPLVPVPAFAGLAQGGPANHWLCECYILACRPLAPHGRTFAKLALPQIRVDHAKTQ